MYIKTAAADNHESQFIRHLNKLQNHNTSHTSRKQYVTLLFN